MAATVALLNHGPFHILNIYSCSVWRAHACFSTRNCKFSWKHDVCIV